MAIIKCPECGSEISDKATACIKCGCPLNNEVSDEIDQKANELDNSESKSAEIKKSKSIEIIKSKKKIIIILLVLIVAIITVVLIASTSLSSDEKYVYNIIDKHKGHLKDPTSLAISNALYVVDSENNLFVFFTCYANNSYGGRVSSIPMYKNGKYIGDVNDDTDDYETKEEKTELLEAQIVYLEWGAYGESMVNSEDGSYRKAKYIDCKKIASKLGCEYEKAD